MKSKVTIRSAVAIILASALVGCPGKSSEPSAPQKTEAQNQQESDTPSESDARQKLEAQIKQEANGLIALVSLQKTDGQMQEVMGVKAYQMMYTAEVAFLDDCLWNGPNAAQWDGHFSASRPAASSAQFRADTLQTREVTKQTGLDARWLKGDHLTFNGRMSFEKTERGWHLITPTDTPQLTAIFRGVATC